MQQSTIHYSAENKQEMLLIDIKKMAAGGGGGGGWDLEGTVE